MKLFTIYQPIHKLSITFMTSFLSRKKNFIFAHKIRRASNIKPFIKNTLLRVICNTNGSLCPGVGVSIFQFYDFDFIHERGWAEPLLTLPFVPIIHANYSHPSSAIRSEIIAHNSEAADPVIKSGGFV